MRNIGSLVRRMKTRRRMVIHFFNHCIHAGTEGRLMKNVMNQYVIAAGGQTWNRGNLVVDLRIEGGEFRK